MYKKICVFCETTSFSTADHQTWLCPNCQEDITHLESKKIDNPDQ